MRWNVTKQLKGVLMKPHVIIEAPSQMEYLRVALVILGAMATGWVLRGLVIC
jgi:hypothetical protein